MATASKVQYKNPPIIESVFEIFFSAKVPWSEELKNSLLKAVPKKFHGKVENLNFHSIDLNVAAGQPITAKSSQPTPRVRCWTESKDRMLQFGPDMVAINAFPRYSTIEDYLPELLAFFEVVATQMKVERVNWLGQRFINQIKTPENVAPTDLFEVYPNLPELVRSNHPPFALQVETAKDANKSIVLNLEYKGLEKNEHVYMLDIYMKSQGFSAVRKDDIMKWMMSSHSGAIETFESSLTSAGKEPYK